MPRYYLNLRYGPHKLAEDPEGDELPGPEAIHAHALTAARNLIALARSHAVRDWFACSFEITGDRGEHVMTVAFADTVSESGGAPN